MVDKTTTVTMEQANITALMDALQNAGYHIRTSNQQIIINADGQATVVDQQKVQMGIDEEMEGVIADVVDPSSVNLVVHEVPEITRENLLPAHNLQVLSPIESSASNSTLTPAINNYF